MCTPCVLQVSAFFADDLVAFGYPRWTPSAATPAPSHGVGGVDAGDGAAARELVCRTPTTKELAYLGKYLTGRHCPPWPCT